MAGRELPPGGQPPGLTPARREDGPQERLAARPAPSGQESLSQRLWRLSGGRSGLSGDEQDALLAERRERTDASGAEALALLQDRLGAVVLREFVRWDRDGAPGWQDARTGEWYATIP